MPPTSSLYLLADRVLEGRLADTLRLYKQAGVSRRAAAYLLTEQLGVEVNPVTVNRWMEDVSR